MCLPTPWFQSSSLRSCERINVCFLRWNLVIICYTKSQEMNTPPSWDGIRNLRKSTTHLLFYFMQVSTLFENSIWFSQTFLNCIVSAWPCTLYACMIFMRVRKTRHTSSWLHWTFSLERKRLEVKEEIIRNKKDDFISFQCHAGLLFNQACPRVVWSLACTFVLLSNLLFC